MHKVQCHPCNLFAYLEELIQEETMYTSDENFDYTFIITTRVTQTAKEIEAEQSTDILTDEMDLICTNISEPVLLQQTFDVKTASPSEQDSQEVKHLIDRLVGDLEVKEDPLEQAFQSTPQENTTNVAFAENSLNSHQDNQENCISSSMKADEANQERCPLCQRPIFFYNLRRHLRNVHNLSKSQINEMNLNARFKCLVCLQILTKLNIKQHFKADHNISNSREVERLHVVVKLSAVPYEDEKSKPIAHRNSVSCTLCTKTLLSMNVKRHLRQTHKLNDAEIKLYLQQKLDAIPKHGPSESSSDSRELNEKVNLIRREGRSYFCALCEDEFTIRSLIMQHFVNNHSDTISQLTDVRFGCDLCSMVLPSFAIFETHQNEHIFRPSKKRYLCNYCGKYLESKTSLDDHIARHINLRQFICDICKRTKNDRNSMSVHMIMHMNKKPHKCSVSGCSAAFAKKAKLREHTILRHTTEKLHQCEICSKKFKLKSYLK